MRTLGGRIAVACLKLGQLGAAFGLLTGVLWFAAQFISDPWDRRWLLFFNTDAPAPVLDAAMLAVTKLTMPLSLILVFLWLAGDVLSRRRVLSVTAVARALRIVGLIVAIALATSPYWYRERQLVAVYYVGALAVPLCIEMVVCSLQRCDAETLRRIRGILWLALASVVLTFLVRNAIAHGLAPRHRPLSEINLDWNGALRRIPDEEVRGGSSYVSGHVSTVFALAAMLVWYIRVRSVQLGLAVWALLVAYSRLYVAAHYPFGVLMAALLGVASSYFTVLILAPGNGCASLRVDRLRAPGDGVAMDHR